MKSEVISKIIKRYLPSKDLSRWIYRHMKRRIPEIAFLAACRIIATVAGVAFAFVTKNLINYAVAQNTEGFIKNCLYLAGLIVLQISLSALALHLQEKLVYSCDKDFKQSIFHTILYSSYAEESKYHSGDLLYRMNSDASNVYSSILSIATSAVSLVVGLVTAAAALASMAPGFTAAIFIICVVLAAATLLAQKNMKGIQKEVSAKAGKVSGFLQEIMEKLLIVQTLGISSTIEQKAETLINEKVDAQRRRKNVYMTMAVGSGILGYTGSFVTLVWCANRVLDGTMDYGTLLAMTTLVSQLQGPLLTLPSILPKFVTVTASGERLMEIEKLKREEITDLADPEELYGKMENIDVRNLSFSYINQSGEKKIVLDNANFGIRKNCMTVITGPSGTGKSTFLKILLGIFSPEGGQISLKLKDGSEMQLDRRAGSLFSFAPQGNLILSGTIRENILISNMEASGKELEEAIYISCMDEYIRELPLGLDTKLGENGTGLSEGQIQRINLARAVIKGAPILLLDEVTSSLDAETEKKVLERICSLKDRTCIVVTHRPAALALADWELHVEDGRVTEIAH